MSDPYFQQLFAERIGGAAYGKGTDIYKFEKIKRAKRKALQEHPERELLDFGIGENDSMADAAVREVMAREINRTENIEWDHTLFSNIFIPQVWNNKDENRYWLL